MRQEYLEEQILHIAEKFKNARMREDKDLCEADMQYIGVLLRMLEFSIDLSKEIRQMGKPNKEVC